MEGRRPTAEILPLSNMTMDSWVHSDGDLYAGRYYAEVIGSHQNLTLQ